MTEIDWYERRNELEPGQVFTTYEGRQVKLDRRVPGDGTDWYVLSRYGDKWIDDDNRIHPGDLVSRVPA